MNKIKKNKMYVILAVMLAACLILYYGVYLYRCYPINEGWHVTYAKLVLNGKVPYRDFYYYMPPLDIFINILFLKLSFGHLLLFRIWMMVLRIVMMELIFWLLSGKVKMEYAFWGTLVGGILISGNCADLLGDYNQTVELICVVLACCLKKYIHAIDERERHRWLLVSGVVLGLGICEKQSLAFASVIVLFVFLLLYCLKIKKISFWHEFVIATGGGY